MGFIKFPYIKRPEYTKEEIQAKDTEGKLVLCLAILKENGIKPKFEVDEYPFDAADIEIEGEKKHIPAGVARNIKVNY